MRQRLLTALREFAAWWAVLLVVDLMFVSSVSALEVVVAAGGAVIAAVAARAVHTASGAGLGGTRRWGAALLAWPGAVAADTARLCTVTARALRGRPAEGDLKTLTLESGTGAAWVCALLSSTPGMYVVDVPRGGSGTGQSVVAHVLTGDRTRLERLVTRGSRR